MPESCSAAVQLKTAGAAGAMSSARWQLMPTQTLLKPKWQASSRLGVRRKLAAVELVPAPSMRALLALNPLRHPMECIKTALRR